MVLDGPGKASPGLIWGARHVGATSVPRLEQTHLSKGSGDNDAVAPGSYGNCWEGGSPQAPSARASNYQPFTSGNTSPAFPHS